MLSYAGEILDTCLAYRSCPEFLKFPRHRLLYPFPAHSVPLLNGTPSRVGGVSRPSEDGHGSSSRELYLQGGASNLASRFGVGRDACYGDGREHSFDL